MKIIYLMVFVLGSFYSFSQKNSVFDTRIERANKVQLTGKDGKIIIEKAEKVVIGTIIIDETLKSSVFLTGFKQEKDSSGKYVTKITFGSNTARKTFFDVELKFIFDEPIEKIVGEGDSEIMAHESYSSDMRKYIMGASQINTFDGLFSYVITSKVPVFTTILGVNGALN